MKRLVNSLVAVLIFGIALLTGVQAMESDDPFLWLEDIPGARALDWVKSQNQVTLRALKSDPQYAQDYQILLQMLDADDRIPFGQLHGSVVLNFWQDQDHVRGVWRQVSISSYES